MKSEKEIHERIDKLLEEIGELREEFHSENSNPVVKRKERIRELVWVLNYPEEKVDMLFEDVKVDGDYAMVNDIRHGCEIYHFSEDRTQKVDFDKVEAL